MAKVIELDVDTAKSILDLLEKIESLIRRRKTWLINKGLPIRASDEKDLETAQFLLKKLTAKLL